MPWKPAEVISRDEAALLPALYGDRVSLRPVGSEHTELLFEAAFTSRAEIGAWLPWCHEDYSREDAAAFTQSRESAWNEGQEFAFAILAADEGEPRFLGVCGLNELHPLHRMANLGYWVRTSETCRGCASDAARLLARFGFLHLGLRRIEIVAAVENKASCRAAEKTGAIREAVLRNRLFVHGRSHNCAVFSFVPEDFGIVERATAGTEA